MFFLYMIFLGVLTTPPRISAGCITHQTRAYSCSVVPPGQQYTNPGFNELVTIGTAGGVIVAP